MTKREYFATIATIVEASTVENKADVIAFIDHEVELLNRKSSGSRKPTERQVQNADYKQAILAILGESDVPMSIPQMMADARLEGLTNQRVSALLIQLGTAKGSGEVVKTYEKKVAYFSLA